MNITAKSRYALKVMMDLAIRQAPSTRNDIASRQGLPVDFMDQIISRLKNAGLISTIRGRSGGLNLNMPAESISLWDIFSSVEDQIFPVVCLSDHSCVSEQDCLTVDVWRDTYKGFKTQLEQKMLSTVILGKKLPEKDVLVMAECRAPKKGATTSLTR